MDRSRKLQSFRKNIRSGDKKSIEFTKYSSFLFSIIAIGISIWGLYLSHYYKSEGGEVILASTSKISVQYGEEASVEVVFINSGTDPIYVVNPDLVFIDGTYDPDVSLFALRESDDWFSVGGKSTDDLVVKVDAKSSEIVRLTSFFDSSLLTSYANKYSSWITEATQTSDEHDVILKFQKIDSKGVLSDFKSVIGRASFYSRKEAETSGGMVRFNSVSDAGKQGVLFALDCDDIQSFQSSWCSTGVR